MHFFIKKKNIYIHDSYTHNTVVVYILVLYVTGLNTIYIFTNAFFVHSFTLNFFFLEFKICFKQNTVHIISFKNGFINLFQQKNLIIDGLSCSKVDFCPSLLRGNMIGAGILLVNAHSQIILLFRSFYASL